jgi:cobalt-zinc-cadmium efflux system protein
MLHDHPPDRGHGHAHVLPHVSAPTMGWAVGLTLAFVIGEALCGWLGHSLALISDAGHNLADAAALGFSWYALTIARRPAHRGMTYGYHRVGVMAALANAVSLAMIALVIVWEAIGRWSHPEVANGGLMIGVAALGIVVNVTISLWLHRGATDDLNIRSVYLHMVGDALSACGVVIAGLIVTVTHSSIADPVVSFFIAGLILWSSWSILQESTTVLLEGTPAGIDMASVTAAMRDVAGVLDVHDLHVWTVGPGIVACSCHVLVAEQTIREGQQVLRAVVHAMEDRFQITHTTVQVEVEGCEPNAMYCSVQRFRHDHPAHTG